MQTPTSTNAIEMRLLSASNLELQLKEAVMAYVKTVEGRSYNCEECYDIHYIHSSKYISKYRKKNMQELDNIFEYYRDNESNLANAVKQFLSIIENKPSLFCLQEKPSVFKKFLMDVLRKNNRSLFMEQQPSRIADLEAALKQVIDQNKTLQAELENLRAKNSLLEQQLKIKNFTIEILACKAEKSPSSAPPSVPYFFGKNTP